MLLQPTRPLRTLNLSDCSSSKQQNLRLKMALLHHPVGSVSRPLATPCTCFRAKPLLARAPRRPDSSSSARFDTRQSCVAPLRRVALHGLGEDVIQSWGDIASLVASESKGDRTPFDGLADKLGKILYTDLGGWHLYLRSPFTSHLSWVYFDMRIDIIPNRLTHEFLPRVHLARLLSKELMGK